MSDSNNINGMQAQNWAPLQVPNIEVASNQPNSLNSDQKQLFNAIVAVIKAAAQDIHGTVDDDKYRYIVDLIVKRLKQVSSNSSDSTIEELKLAFENAKNPTIDVESIVKDAVSKVSETDAKTYKAAIDSAISNAQLDANFNDSLASKLAEHISKLEAAKTDEETAAIKEEFEQFFKDKKSEIEASSKNVPAKTYLKDGQYVSSDELDPIEKAVQDIYGSVSGKDKNSYIIKISKQLDNINKQLTKQQETISNEIQKTASISTPDNGKGNAGSGILASLFRRQSAEDGSKTSAGLSNLMKKSPAAVLTIAALGVAVMPVMSAIKTGFSAVKKTIGIIASSVAKMSKVVLGTLGAGLLAMLMTPGGMYAIGFVAGYVWNKWLKKWWDKIKGIFGSLSDFFSGISGSSLWSLLRFGLRGALLWKFFKLESLVKKFTGLSKGIKGIVAGLFKGVWKAIKFSVDLVAKGIKGIWSAAKGIWNTAKGIFTGTKTVKNTAAAIKTSAKVAKTAKSAKVVKNASTVASKAKDIKPAFKGASVRRDPVTGRFASMKNASTTAKNTKAANAATKTAKAMGNASSKGSSAAGKAVGKTALKKAGKVAVRALRILGTAAGAGLTFVLNKLELKALMSAAKEFCEQNGAKTLDDLLTTYGFVDENGNDITDEIHFEAQNFKNEIEMKMATSNADLAAEALNFLIPGAGLVAQIGTQALTQRMLEGDRARREGLMNANKTTKLLASSLREGMRKSQEIKDKINNMQDSAEKQKALKERLEKLQRAKALYKKLDAREKEASKQLEDLNTGMFAFLSSSEKLTHWQNIEDESKRSKLRLLKEHGFSSADMRDEANKKLGDVDGMTEEQHLAKQLLEAEVADTGDISEDTYSMYAKAFKIKESYAQNKDKLLSTKFAKARKEFMAQNQSNEAIEIRGLSDQLQSRIDNQQNVLNELGSNNEKIINALQENNESQQKANEETIDRLKSIQESIQRIPAPTNNMSVVSTPPPQQNMAALENSNASRKIF